MNTLTVRIGTKRREIESKMFDGDTWLKRKSMHQKTFDALYKKWTELKLVEDDYFALKLLPILKKHE